MQGGAFCLHSIPAAHLRAVLSLRCGRVRVMRIIAHLDMDAFFAAVEEREKPWLRGMPVVVGADPLDGEGRGVVSTANYIARSYGIRSAMPIARAWKLSEAARRSGKPGALFITPRFSKYEHISSRIMTIARNYTREIEIAGLDEAHLDLSFLGSFDAARAHCQSLQREIHRRELLTASVGIASNKLLAKIASDFKKPSGLTVVEPGEAEYFLGPLPIRSISGIGAKTAEIFARMGVRTIADARALSRKKLAQLFQKRGAILYENFRGRDDTPLAKRRPVQSLGEQETLLKDTSVPDILLGVLMKSVNRVWARIHRRGLKGLTRIVLTVRFEDFSTVSRSRTMRNPVVARVVFERETLRLFLPFLDRRENPEGKPIRLVGIRAERLLRKEVRIAQGTLFSQ